MKFSGPFISSSGRFLFPPDKLLQRIYLTARAKIMRNRLESSPFSGSF